MHCSQAVQCQIKPDHHQPEKAHNCKEREVNSMLPIKRRIVQTFSDNAIHDSMKMSVSNRILSLVKIWGRMQTVGIVKIKIPTRGPLASYLASTGNMLYMIILNNELSTYFGRNPNMAVISKHCSYEITSE